MDSEESDTAKRVQLEELSRMKETVALKDELLMHIARELRSSLSLIQEPIKKLAKKASETSNDEGPHPIEVLRNKIGRMGQVIKQLDDVNQIRAYGSDLAVTEVEVCSLLRRYIAFFESKAQQKGVVIHADLPDYEIIQTLDPDKFEKIILILISNALKFTREGERVEVQLAEGEHQTNIVIKDTGRGISEEKLNNIFYDKSRAEAEAEGNIGVRLSIIKKYVQLHEGAISVDSEKGKGTVFRLSFPKRAESLKKAEAKELDFGYDLLSHESFDQDRPLLFSNSSAEKTILIVEDNRNMRDYMVALLSKEGLNIEVAENGREALKQLAVMEPDLIISDIMMPEMDGFEFVEKLRSDPQNQLIPVIMISAKAEEEARIHGFHIGISDYLVKPFSEPELKARVKNLLRQKLEREKYLTNDERQEAETHEQSLVERLKEYIERRIKNETITIRELSQSVNTSRRQLYRDLKAYTGFTPAEFVREVKLRKARHLLEQSTKATVAEVAHEVGYNTAAHFSKIFKKRFGRNPSEYK